MQYHKAQSDSVILQLMLILDTNIALDRNITSYAKGFHCVFIQFHSYNYTFTFIGTNIT